MYFEAWVLWVHLTSGEFILFYIETEVSDRVLLTSEWSDRRVDSTTTIVQDWRNQISNSRNIVSCGIRYSEFEEALA